MSTSYVNLHLNPTVNKKLTAIADSLGVSPQKVLRDLIKTYPMELGNITNGNTTRTNA